MKKDENNWVSIVYEVQCYLYLNYEPSFLDALSYLFDQL